jgi:hypothetical protein
LAIEENNYRVVDDLIKGTDPNIKNKTGLNIMSYCIIKNNFMMAYKILTSALALKNDKYAYKLDLKDLHF